MKIVIVGGGKVGFAIAREVSAEGHDVTIIDSSRAVCDRLSLALDGMTVQGNGAALDVQHAALVPESDLLIAASPNDEANILACMLARKLGCANTIARIRSRSYLDGVQLLREELGLSMAVTPDLYAAREIFRQLQLPAFLRRESFAKSRAEIVAMEVDADNKLCGKKLMELPRVLRHRVLVCAVRRGEEAFIPDGSFAIRAGDEVYLTAPAATLSRTVDELGLRKKHAKNVMIVGGGRLGEALAELLREAGVRVKLIEHNAERCRELAERLPDVSVLCADGTRQDFLFSENISQMDAVVALTNLDEENVFICMYARMQGVPQAIPRVNRTEYAAVCQNCGIRSAVSPKDICVQEITRYVRTMESTDAESVLSVYSLLGGRVEALEFLVTADVPHLGESLASVTLQPGILLACISRGAKVIFPGGGDSLQAGDTVIVVAPRERHIAELRQIFAERG